MRPDEVEQGDARARELAEGAGGKGVPSCRPGRGRLRPGNTDEEEGWAPDSKS